MLGDRLTLQATISGSTQHANAPQKINARIGPAENGKGRNCIFSGVVYTLANRLRFKPDEPNESNEKSAFTPVVSSPRKSMNLLSRKFVSALHLSIEH